jgi:hypothetical protein
MIPKRFEIGGKEIRVKRRRKVLTDDGEAVEGLFIPQQNTILVSTWFDGKKLPEEAIEHAFYHELSHVIMAALNDWKFYHNEPKIDMMGSILHQFEKSKK